MFLHDDSIALPRMVQRNLPSGRVYTVEDTGEVFPSITRVLGGTKDMERIDAWRERVGETKAEGIKRNAAIKGTALHTQAELYLENKPLKPLMPNVAELWSKLRPWIDKNVRKVYKQEANVFSRKLCVAGRFDLLADNADDELVVIDFKNSRTAKKDEYIVDYKLQGTFYSLAVYELTGRKVKRVHIPIVNPNTPIQVYTYRPLEYLDGLLERINQFYSDFETSLLTEAK